MQKQLSQCVLDAYTHDIEQQENMHVFGLVLIQPCFPESEGQADKSEARRRKSNTLSWTFGYEVLHL